MSRQALIIYAVIGLTNRKTEMPKELTCGICNFRNVKDDVDYKVKIDMVLLTKCSNKSNDLCKSCLV